MPATRSAPIGNAIRASSSSEDLLHGPPRRASQGARSESGLYGSRAPSVVSEQAAEVSHWRQYVKRLGDLNPVRIEAQEKPKVQKENVKSLMQAVQQHKALFSGVQRLQDQRTLQPKLIERVLETLSGIEKACDRLRVTDADVEKTERAMIQAEFALSEDAPRFVAQEHDAEDSYKLLKSHGFDFAGPRIPSDETYNADPDISSSSVNSVGAYHLGPLMRRIDILEDRILAIQSEKALIVERRVFSSEPSQKTVEILNDYDEEERSLSEHLGLAMSNLDRAREVGFSGVQQDTSLKSAGDPITPVCEGQSIVQAPENSNAIISHVATIIKTLASNHLYPSLVLNADRGQHRERVPTSDEFINSWLLHQLRTQPGEIDRYLSTISDAMEKLEASNVQSPAQTNARDNAGRGEKPSKGMKMRDRKNDVEPGARSSAKARDHEVGQLGRGHKVIAGPEEMLYLWFHDETSSSAQQPSGHVPAFSTHVNVNSRGVISASYTSNAAVH